MQVLLFLSRPLVIMTWCKMWDLGFGAADAANPYGQMEDAMPAPPPRRPPRAAPATRAAATGTSPTACPTGTPRSGRAAAPTCLPPRRSSERPRRRKIRFVRAFRCGTTRVRSIRDARSDDTHDTHDTRGGTQLLTRTVSAFVHEERRDDIRCLFDASSRRTRVSRLLVPNLNRDVAPTRRRARRGARHESGPSIRLESHIVPRTARARTTHSPPLLEIKRRTTPSRPTSAFKRPSAPPVAAPSSAPGAHCAFTLLAASDSAGWP